MPLQQILLSRDAKPSPLEAILLPLGSFLYCYLFCNLPRPYVRLPPPKKPLPHHDMLSSCGLDFAYFKMASILVNSYKFPFRKGTLYTLKTSIA